MKRVVTILMMVLLTITLVACGSTEPTTPNLSFEKAEREDLSFNDETLHCVCVYTEYTNTTDESILPADDVSVKAYQNGTQLSPWVFTGTETNGYVQCDTSVQSGATAKVVWIFEVKDDSEITVEFSASTKMEGVTLE